MSFIRRLFEKVSVNMSCHCMDCLKFQWVESRRWLWNYFSQVGQRHPEASASTVRDSSAWTPFDLASHFVHPSSMGHIFHHLVPRCTSQIWPWTQRYSLRKGYERHSSHRWTDYVCVLSFEYLYPLSSIHYSVLFIRRLVQEWYTRQGNTEGTSFRFLSLESVWLRFIPVEKALKDLMKQRRDKVEEIKKKTNYYSTRDLLQKYDESSPAPPALPLRQRFSSSQPPPVTPQRPIPQPSGGNSALQTPSAGLQAQLSCGSWYIIPWQPNLLQWQP